MVGDAIGVTSTSNDVALADPFVLLTLTTQRCRPDRPAVLIDTLRVWGVVPLEGVSTIQPQSRPKVFVNATLPEGLLLMVTLCGDGAPPEGWYEKLISLGVATRDSALTVRLTERFSGVFAASGMVTAMFPV